MPPALQKHVAMATSQCEHLSPYPNAVSSARVTASAQKPTLSWAALGWGSARVIKTSSLFELEVGELLPMTP